MRTLKAFKNRAEVLEILDNKNGMISGFFKQAKWYCDEDGGLVLKFEAQSTIDTIKMFKGEQLFVSVVSEVTGRALKPTDLKCECGASGKGDDTIDRIIEAAENA